MCCWYIWRKRILIDYRTYFSVEALYSWKFSKKLFVITFAFSSQIFCKNEKWISLELSRKNENEKFRPNPTLDPWYKITHKSGRMIAQKLIKRDKSDLGAWSEPSVPVSVGSSGEWWTLPSHRRTENSAPLAIRYGIFMSE
jgi:hypothetical protein